MKVSSIMMNSVKLHDYFEKCRKCVGIAKHKGKFYYAISGEDGKKTNTIAKDIEIMIGGKDCIRCFIDKTFTVLRLGDYRSPKYKCFENYIYECLYSGGKAVFIFPEYLGSHINFEKFMLSFKPWYNVANFSCVERKIIGTIRNKSVDITIGCRPCYKCLPSIKNVTYYDQVADEVHSICLSKTVNTFTFTRTF